jgi:hypothetical protein
MADGPGPVNSIVPGHYSVQTDSMKNRWGLCVLLLGVAACAPLSIYHRPGVAVAKMEDDLLGCQVVSLEQAPVASQVRQGPPIYVPGRYYCNKRGHCYRQYGYYIPGDIYTIDVNASLRRKLETRCMARKGYQRVEIPNCPAGVTMEPSPADTQVLPPLTENSCAIRGSGGTWQIVEIKNAPGQVQSGGVRSESTSQIP